MLSTAHYHGVRYCVRVYGDCHGAGYLCENDDYVSELRIAQKDCIINMKPHTSAVPK